MVLPGASSRTPHIQALVFAEAHRIHGGQFFGLIKWCLARLELNVNSQNMPQNPGNTGRIQFSNHLLAITLYLKSQIESFEEIQKLGVCNHIILMGRASESKHATL